MSRSISRTLTAALCSASLLMSCGPSPTPTPTGNAAPAVNQEAAPEAIVRIDPAQLQTGSKQEAELTASGGELQLRQELPADLPPAETADNSEATAVTARLQVHENTLIGGGRIAAQTLHHPELAAAIGIQSNIQDQEGPVMVELRLDQVYPPGIVQLHDLDPQTGVLTPRYTSGPESLPHIATISADGQTLQFALDALKPDFATQQARLDYDMVLAVNKNYLEDPAKRLEMSAKIIDYSQNFGLLDYTMATGLKQVMSGSSSALNLGALGTEMYNISESNMHRSAKDMAQACVILSASVDLASGALPYSYYLPAVKDVCSAGVRVVNYINNAIDELNEPYVSSLGIETGFGARVNLRQIQTPFRDGMTGNEHDKFPNALFRGRPGAPESRTHFRDLLSCPNNSCAAVFGNPDYRMNRSDPQRYEEMYLRGGAYLVEVQPLGRSELIELALSAPQTPVMKPGASAVRFTTYLDIKQSHHRVQLERQRPKPDIVTAQEAVALLDMADAENQRRNAASEQETDIALRTKARLSFAYPAAHQDKAMYCFDGPQGVSSRPSRYYCNLYLTADAPRFISDLIAEVSTSDGKASWQVSGSWSAERGEYVFSRQITTDDIGIGEHTLTARLKRIGRNTVYTEARSPLLRIGGSQQKALSFSKPSGDTSIGLGGYYTLELQTTAAPQNAFVDIYIGTALQGRARRTGDQSFAYELNTVTLGLGEHEFTAILRESGRTANLALVRSPKLTITQAEPPQNTGGGGGNTTPPANQAPNTPSCNTCPTYALAGQSLSFSFGLSDSNSGDSLKALINWGDGNTEELSRSGNGTVSASHTYSTPGTYTVQIRARDGAGLTSSVRSHSVTIDSTHNHLELEIK